MTSLFDFYQVHFWILVEHNFFFSKLWPNSRFSRVLGIVLCQDCRCGCWKISSILYPFDIGRNQGHHGSSWGRQAVGSHPLGPISICCLITFDDSLFNPVYRPSPRSVMPNMPWLRRQQSSFMEVKDLSSLTLLLIFFLPLCSRYGTIKKLSKLLVEAVSKALLATHVLFGASLDSIKGQELVNAFEHDSRMVQLSRASVAEMNVDRLALESGLCSSKCKVIVQRPLVPSLNMKLT